MYQSADPKHGVFMAEEMWAESKPFVTRTTDSSQLPRLENEPAQSMLERFLEILVAALAFPPCALHLARDEFDPMFPY